MNDDAELLRRYARENAADAFAELVRRRIDFVYAAALRQTRGNAALASDVTQTVFIDVARKASVLARHAALIGWLHTATRFAAGKAMRKESRRNAREQEAHAMQEMSRQDAPEIDWTRLQPVLDDVLGELKERERTAILLRFFEGKRLAEIGARLELSEEAARSCVDRALDKLNAALARRGITSTTAALSLALGQQVGAVTPPGLAATITGTALAQATASAGGWLATISGMGKLQVGIASAVAVIGATGYFVQARTNAALRNEIAAVRERQKAVASLRAENQQLASVAAEIETLRRDDAEYKQLAQRIEEARKVLAENARLARRREAQQASDGNVQAEIDRMNREGNALVEQFKALTARSKDPSLPAGENAAAEAAAKLKLAEIQAKQREVQSYIALHRGSMPPQFQAVTAESRRLPATAREQWSPLDNERVSLRIPQADYPALLSVYQRATGQKVIRDPSLIAVSDTFDLQTGPSTREELIEALRTALRDKLNIILEPAADGSVVARVGPPR